jgi:hypothetical protein
MKIRQHGMIPRLGPDLLLVLLVAVMPFSALISAAIDGAIQMRNANGEVEWVTQSSHGSTVLQLLGGVLFVCAAFRIVNDILFRRGKRLGSIKILPLLWPIAILFGQIWRGTWISAITTLISLILVLAILIRPWSVHTGIWIARLYVGIALSTILYAIAEPSRSLRECREDKCSPIGGLFSSFFPHENVLAFFFMVGPMLSIAFFRNVWMRFFATLLFLTLVVASGSRMAIVGAVVATIVTILMTSRRRVAMSTVTEKTVRVAILGLTIASLGSLFLGFEADFLTGRGDIYGLLYNLWLQQPLFGPGREILQVAYEAGNTWNFLIAHEHGQGPYLLINGGLLASIAFMIWIVSLLTRTGEDVGRQYLVLGILFALSVAFLTEPVWQFAYSSPLFGILLLVMSLTNRTRTQQSSLPKTGTDVNSRGK